MKIVVLLLVAAAVVYGVAQERSGGAQGMLPSHSSDSLLREAYESKKSGLQVRGEGVVIKTLTDDLEGSRHQRFVLRLDSGRTLLIAHNIDLAPRIGGLKPGDTVEFYGEYEWNSKGGVIHWTHHDPGNNHVAGWLKHEGRTYQ